MKDPHEHSDMPHESEDVRKRDCRKYKELYGKHFTKDLCEWAVERMEIWSQVLFISRQF